MLWNGLSPHSGSSITVHGLKFLRINTGFLQAR